MVSLIIGIKNLLIFFYENSTLKALDTVCNYTKSLLAQKPYLVMSNGELLKVKNIVRKGSH